MKVSMALRISPVILSTMLFLSPVAFGQQTRLVPCGVPAIEKGRPTGDSTAVSLSFVENRGQWPDAGVFVLRRQGLVASFETLTLDCRDVL